MNLPASRPLGLFSSPRPWSVPAMLAAASVLAQAPPSTMPDLISADSRGSWPFSLFAYVWDGAAYQRSLYYDVTPNGITAMTWDLDNETILVNMNRGLEVRAVAPAGARTLFRLSPDPLDVLGSRALMIHQSGDLLGLRIQGSWRLETHLVRMDRRGSITSKIASMEQGETYGLSQDLESGDYILGALEAGGGRVLRVTETGIVTTLFLSPPTRTYGWGSAWSPDYRAGGLVGMVAYDGAVRWARIDLTPQFQVRTLHIPPYGTGSGEAAAPALFESRRLFGVATNVVWGPSIPFVQEVSSFGGSVRDHLVTGPQQVTYRYDVRPLILGERKIAGKGPARPGTAYILQLRFPGQAFLRYRIGASLAVRPGMELPGGTYIPLHPDALLLRSLTDPQIFEGFSGRLDRQGMGVGAWRIPPIPGLKGLRVFFAALTYDETGIREVSQPIGVTVL